MVYAVLVLDLYANLMLILVVLIKILTLPSLYFFERTSNTSLKYVFLYSSINSEYADSLIISSLTTSFPDEFGFVQNTPLALWPLIESGSPGICVKDIAPKFVIPSGPLKSFISKISL